MFEYHWMILDESIWIRFFGEQASITTSRYRYSSAYLKDVCWINWQNCDILWLYNLTLKIPINHHQNHFWKLCSLQNGSGWFWYVLVEKLVEFQQTSFRTRFLRMRLQSKERWCFDTVADDPSFRWLKVGNKFDWPFVARVGCSDPANPVKNLLPWVLPEHFLLVFGDFAKQIQLIRITKTLHSSVVFLASDFLALFRLLDARNNEVSILTILHVRDRGHREQTPKEVAGLFSGLAYSGNCWLLSSARLFWRVFAKHVPVSVSNTSTTFIAFST